MTPDAGGAAAASGDESGSVWSVLEGVAAEPALLQLILVLVLAGLLWLLVARWSRLVREARSRAAVRDFVLGTEQVLHGDDKGAAQRLGRVVDRDPGNLGARFLYARALAGLGRAAEAHRLHLELERGLGMNSVPNEVALAENLLTVGRADEAVEPAGRAVQLAPDDPRALRVLFRSQVVAGLPEPAAETGRRLARRLPSGSERLRVEAEVVDALALAAEVCLDRGDTEGARRLLQGASPAGSEQRPGWRLQRTMARLTLAEKGEDALLAAAPAASESAGGDQRLLPVQVSEGALGEALAPLPAAVRGLAALVPTAPYQCEVCGASAGSALRRCTLCGVEGRVVPCEPSLYEELDSPLQVMDAIEENRAHVRRLLDGVRRGDEGAEAELIELGAGSVEEVLAAAMAAGPGDDTFVVVLQRMGSGILPDLFTGYRRRKEVWLTRFGDLFGRQSIASVVGRVVQGFGRDALGEMGELLSTADRDLRKILIDYYLGLGDAVEFRVVLEGFPPFEVVQRLNAAPAPVLQGFLASVQPDTFLSEVLLADSAFTRAHDLFLCLAQAQHPEMLRAVLARRGFSRSLTALLIEQLASAGLSAHARALLDQFGERTVEQQVAAYMDLDRREEVRDALAERLHALGPAVVPRLCDGFGGSATALDDGVHALLVGLGTAALDPLVQAYRQGSVLEKFAGPLVKRHNHRRDQILRAIRAIGGEAAERRLRRLHDDESDADLKLRIAQALHEVRREERGGSPPPEEARDG